MQRFTSKLFTAHDVGFKHLSLALAIGLATTTSACTRTMAGSGLLATGAAAGYCGIQLVAGDKASAAQPTQPQPQVQAGVPLILSGALASGIGISLIAMGDARPNRAKPTRSRINEEPPLPLVYPKPAADPWSSDRSLSDPPLTYAAKPFTTEVHR